MVRVWRRNWTSAARRYSEADAIVVSVGKSGRTWLRVFLYSYFCRSVNREFTIRARKLADTSLPKLVFTHDLWGYRNARKLRDRLRGKQLIPPLESRTKQIILLVRDPRDVIVSLFFHVTKRSRRYNGVLSEMIRHPKYGLDLIIDVMNTWISQWGARPDFKLLRYEDCRRNTETAFRDVLAFLGFREIDESIFTYSLQFSSFENMKHMESTGQFKTGILSARDVNDPESYKTRRGIVGGFKDYLGPADIQYMNEALTRLDERFGYAPEANERVAM